MSLSNIVQTRTGGGNLPPDNGSGPGVRLSPHIELIAKKFNLAIDFNYSAQSTDQTPYGHSRSASVDGHVLSDTSGNGIVSVVRGDFSQFPYSMLGTAGGVTTYTGANNGPVVNTLTYDGTQFTEHFANGVQMVYQAQVAGGSPATHQLVAVKDASGVQHTYTYGSGAEAGLLKSIALPGGNLVTFAYAASTGTSLLSNVQDWSNRRWTFQYDSNRNMTTYTSPLGCQTVYGYANAGASVSMLQTVLSPTGYLTTYAYDSSKRVVSMAAGSAVWTWVHDDTHSITTLTYPSGAVMTVNYSAGNVSSINTPEGYTVSYSYTGNRLMTQQQVPAGTVYSVTYDSKLFVVTASDDALGNRTSYQYDSNANLTTMTMPDGGVYTYAYSTPSNRLRTGMTDPLSRRSTWTYSADGLLQTAVDPRGLVTSYNYDSFGNLASIVASDGGITTLQYDSLNRLTTQTDALARTSTFAWDNGDNMVGQTDPTGAATTYVYSTCLLQAVVDPLGHRTSYSYGRFGNLVSMVDAVGNVSTYNFDNMGCGIS